MGKKAFQLKTTILGLAASMLLMSATPSLGQESLNLPNSSAKENSPNTAFWWSLVGTVAPLAAVAAGGDLGRVGLAGLLIGPSLGYFYGGLAWRGLLGIGMRGIGGAVMLFAGGALVESLLDRILFSPWNADRTNHAEAFAALTVGASIMVLGSAIWDLAAVKGSVNERNLRRRGKMISCAPLLNPSAKTVGFTLRLSF